MTGFTLGIVAGALWLLFFVALGLTANGSPRHPFNRIRTFRLSKRGRAGEPQNSDVSPPGLQDRPHIRLLPGRKPASAPASSPTVEGNRPGSRPDPAAERPGRFIPPYNYIRPSGYRIPAPSEALTPTVAWTPPDAEPDFPAASPEFSSEKWDKDVEDVQPSAVAVEPDSLAVDEEAAIGREELGAESEPYELAESRPAQVADMADEDAPSDLRALFEEQSASLEEQGERFEPGSRHSDHFRAAMDMLARVAREVEELESTADDSNGAGGDLVEGEDTRPEEGTEDLYEMAPETIVAEARRRDADGGAPLAGENYRAEEGEDHAPFDDQPAVVTYEGVSYFLVDERGRPVLG